MAGKFKTDDSIKTIKSRGKDPSPSNTGIILRFDPQSRANGWRANYIVRMNDGTEKSLTGQQLDFYAKAKTTSVTFSRKQVTDKLNKTMEVIAEKTSQMKAIKEQIAFMDLGNTDELDVNLYKSYKIMNLVSPKEGGDNDLQKAAEINDLLHGDGITAGM